MQPGNHHKAFFSLRKPTTHPQHARFLGSHRRALAFDNMAITKQKNVFFGVLKLLLIYFNFSFLCEDHFEIVSRLGDGSGNGQYTEADRTSLTASDRRDRLTIFGISNCPGPQEFFVPEACSSR